MLKVCLLLVAVAFMGLVSFGAYYAIVDMTSHSDVNQPKVGKFNILAADWLHGKYWWADDDDVNPVEEFN